MGFGKKTDYESGRTLDLDATYEAIIKPAVELAGMQCIRANEILHSGVIDERMFEMLLRADLVIADISTGNVNAVYELGVRHALRPRTTIIMMENEGRLHFDLNHVSTFMYRHLGEDIGQREAQRASKELGELIEGTMVAANDDSPVYTFIPGLKQPVLSDIEYEQLLEDAKTEQDSFSELLDNAERAADDSDHMLAASMFQLALAKSTENSYLRQQSALHTYKSKHPSAWLALVKAAHILEPLQPEQSNDPETLGIAGAVYKRMWDLNEDPATLDTAITHYRRGFEVRGDYYNGENAATCLELRSARQASPDEATYDQMTAKKIRARIVEDLEVLIDGDEFEDRSDKLWVFATLANCCFTLEFLEKATEYEKRFFELSPKEWEKETYLAGKERINIS